MPRTLPVIINQAVDNLTTVTAFSNNTEAFENMRQDSNASFPIAHLFEPETSTGVLTNPGSIRETYNVKIQFLNIDTLAGGNNPKKSAMDSEQIDYDQVAYEMKTLSKQFLTNLFNSENPDELGRREIQNFGDITFTKLMGVFDNHMTGYMLEFGLELLEVDSLC